MIKKWEDFFETGKLYYYKHRTRYRLSSWNDQWGGVLIFLKLYDGATEDYVSIDFLDASGKIITATQQLERKPQENWERIE